MLHAIVSSSDNLNDVAAGRCSRCSGGWRGEFSTAAKALTDARNEEQQAQEADKTAPWPTAAERQARTGSEEPAGIQRAAARTVESVRAAVSAAGVPALKPLRATDVNEPVTGTLAVATVQVMPVLVSSAPEVNISVHVNLLRVVGKAPLLLGIPVSKIAETVPEEPGGRFKVPATSSTSTVTLVDCVSVVTA